MSYIPKHFKPQEFLPNENYDLSVMDDRILELADLVRELLGVPCTINANGRTLCGFRPKDCKIGAPKSQHKLGKAVDLHPIGMTADDGRTIIRKAVDAGGLVNLGGVELGVNWIHIDCRDRINGKVLYFSA